MNIVETRPNGTKRVALKCETPSMTRQSDKRDTDINYLMQKFQKTGYFPPIPEGFARYVEVPETDYHQAMDTLLDTQQAFSQLPSSVRDRFKNDPSELLAFLDNPENYQEAVELGLMVPRENKPGEKPPGGTPPGEHQKGENQSAGEAE